MTQIPPIQPPTNLSPKPDKATKSGLPDQTGDSAGGRVLHINFWFFKYGTDDKSHAAAMIFSFVILFMIAGTLAYCMFHNGANFWVDKVFNWLENTFLFVVGVALGHVGSKHKDNINNHD